MRSVTLVSIPPCIRAATRRCALIGYGGQTTRPVRSILVESPARVNVLYVMHTYKKRDTHAACLQHNTTPFVALR